MVNYHIEILKGQREPRLFGHSVKSRHLPEADPYFSKLANQLDHCELIHRDRSPRCEGCPALKCCQEFVNIVAQKQAQSVAISEVDYHMYSSIIGLFSKIADGGNNHV